MSIKMQKVARAINVFAVLTILGVTLTVGTCVALVLTILGASAGDVVAVLLACGLVGVMCGVRATQPAGALGAVA